MEFGKDLTQGYKALTTVIHKHVGTSYIYDYGP